LGMHASMFLELLMMLMYIYCVAFVIDPCMMRFLCVYCAMSAAGCSLLMFLAMAGWVGPGGARMYWTHVPCLCLWWYESEQ